MHAKIARIMNQKMDRTSFLQFTGGVLVAVIGLRGLLAALSDHDSPTRRSGGYGQTPYGS